MARRKLKSLVFMEQQTCLSQERTMLAMIRTGLAFIGLGLVVINWWRDWYTRVIGVILLVIGFYEVSRGYKGLAKYKKEVWKLEKRMKKKKKKRR